jgi:uncharacterized membrane protein YoaK (UPF0700 family)
VRRLSPSTLRDLLLIGLTVASGAVDAISFLGLGKVFTAFMTGNVVFLGIGAAGAGGPEVVRVIAALIPFGAGVFVATRIVRPTRASGVWPRGVTVTLSVAMIAQAGFLAIWAAVGGHPATGTASVLLGISALAMGMQSGAVLSLGVRGIFTTAATATMIFLTSDWPESAAERRRLAGVLAGLLAGAGAGGLLLIHARTYAPALPLAATVLVVAAGRMLRARVSQ